MNQNELKSTKLDGIYIKQINETEYKFVLDYDNYEFMVDDDLRINPSHLEEPTYTLCTLERYDLIYQINACEFANGDEKGYRIETTNGKFYVFYKGNRVIIVRRDNYIIGLPEFDNATLKSNSKGILEKFNKAFDLASEFTTPLARLEVQYIFTGFYSIELESDDKIYLSRFENRPRDHAFLLEVDKSTFNVTNLYRVYTLSGEVYRFGFRIGTFHKYLPVINLLDKTLYYMQCDIFSSRIKQIFKTSVKYNTYLPQEFKFPSVSQFETM